MSKSQLLTNHFKVNVSNVDGQFFHYSVALFYEDGCPVDAKGVGRKVIDKVHETYKSELDGKEFAYDGEKSLFTVGALPRNILEFTVVLDSMNSTRYIFADIGGGVLGCRGFHSSSRISQGGLSLNIGNFC
ncbi:putative argonaute, linker 1 domain, protein argonaute [Helianthus anomalus]